MVYLKNNGMSDVLRRMPTKSESHDTDHHIQCLHNLHRVGCKDNLSGYIFIHLLLQNRCQSANKHYHAFKTSSRQMDVWHYIPLLKHSTPHCSLHLRHSSSCRCFKDFIDSFDFRLKKRTH
jgi:hypothetical protein